VESREKLGLGLRLLLKLVSVVAAAYHLLLLDGANALDTPFNSHCHRFGLEFYRL